MFTSFWLQKPKIGPKKILITFFLICLIIPLNKLLFIFILGLTILFFGFSIRKYGYNILIEEFLINDQKQRIIDYINPWKHNHIRMITNDYGTLSAIDINNPKNNLYLSGLVEIINNKNNSLKFLHIGGGACSTPIQLSHIFTNSSHIVIEINSQMIFIAHNFFLPFSANNKITQIQSDAKKYKFKKNEKYEYIIQDLFTKIPNKEPFLTKKWISKLLKHLKKNGTLIINTSSKSQETALNLALELKNIREIVQIIKLEKTYLVVVKNE